LPQKLKNRNYKYYIETRKLIKETEYLSEEELEKFQFSKLQDIVNYAWGNIEGYRELWQKNNFEPSKLKSLKDIELIPFVTKEILRDSIDKFTNKKLSNLRYMTTGGSTGIPFGFYEQTHNSMIETAFIHDMWSRFYKDINLDTKKVTLRGNKIKNIYEYDSISGLTISSYDINIQNIKEYIKQINKSKYSIFQAYPSALYLMAKIMKENNLKLNHKFEAIMFGSEPLYDFQKELIKEVFDTKLCYWYGHSEKAILAGNTSNNNDFFVYPQYGITEIIDGELVGTSFWNYATPFIRYKTNDYAKISNKTNDINNYILLSKIDGRLQDYIVNKDKELVTLTALIFAQHFNCFSKIVQMQLYQEEIGHVVVKIIPTENFNSEDKKEIIDKMLYASHNKIVVFIEIVNNIQRTKASKLKFLDQHLDMKEFLK
jgi:phenylacetate-CoA ligase